VAKTEHIETSTSPATVDDDAAAGQDKPSGAHRLLHILGAVLVGAVLPAVLVGALVEDPDGAPGGAAAFISVGELDVYALVSGPPPSGGGQTARTPLYEYPHNGTTSAVTAGTFYTGSLYPAAYQGAFFFGDYPNGWMRIRAPTPSFPLAQRQAGSAGFHAAKTRATVVL